MLPLSAGFEEVHFTEGVQTYPVHRMMQVSATSWRCRWSTLVHFVHTIYCPVSHLTCNWTRCLFTNRIENHTVLDKWHLSLWHEPCISYWLPPDEESQRLRQETHPSPARAFHLLLASTGWRITASSTRDTSLADTSLPSPTGFHRMKNHSIFDKRHIPRRHEPWI
jgi:hypothetical protein